MAGLALFFVALGFLSEGVDGLLRDVLVTLGWLVTIVFVAEFASRLLAASDRRGYVRGHWIDLLALVPIARAARVLSLLRFLPIGPGMARLTRATGRVQRTLSHHGQVWLFVAWLVLMLACSFFLYGYATSSSSGAARLAGGVLLVMGIGMFSAVTAALTSVLLRGPRDPAAELSEQLRELGALREAGLVTSDEYGARRAAIMRSITPHERGHSAS